MFKSNGFVLLLFILNMKFGIEVVGVVERSLLNIIFSFFGFLKMVLVVLYWLLKVCFLM